MKHEGFTPGPWIASTRPGRAVIFRAAGDDNCDSSSLAEAFMYGDESERRANQRLIADAPALLAERDRLREALEAMMYQFDTDEEDYDCIVLARAALAASKGE